MLIILPISLKVSVTLVNDQGLERVLELMLKASNQLSY